LRRIGRLTPCEERPRAAQRPDRKLATSLCDLGKDERDEVSRIGIDEARQFNALEWHARFLSTVEGSWIGGVRPGASLLVVRRDSFCGRRQLTLQGAQASRYTCNWARSPRDTDSACP